MKMFQAFRMKTTDGIPLIRLPPKTSDEPFFAGKLPTGKPEAYPSSFDASCDTRTFPTKVSSFQG